MKAEVVNASAFLFRHGLMKNTPSFYSIQKFNICLVDRGSYPQHF